MERTRQTCRVAWLFKGKKRRIKFKNMKGEPLPTIRGGCPKNFKRGEDERQDELGCSRGTRKRAEGS